MSEQEHTTQESPNGDGWTELTETRERVAGFFVIEPGAICQGLYMGHWQDTDPQTRAPRFTHRVRLTAPTRVRDEEGGIVTASVGVLIGVNEKKQLEKLRDLAEGQHEIWFRVKGKRELDNGRTTWDISLRSRALQAPLPF